MLPTEAEGTQEENLVDGCNLVMNGCSLVSSILSEFEHKEGFKESHVTSEQSDFSSRRLSLSDEIPAEN